MKAVLLAAAASIAAITWSSAPALAQDFTGGSFHSGGFKGPDFNGAFPAVTQNQGWGVHARAGFGVGEHRDGDHRRRHDRRNTNGVVLGDWYGGEWALYNNRSWEPDSFNDWWHDNPERAYPAWMRRNREHCDRMWWSGDTLVC